MLLYGATTNSGKLAEFVLAQQKSGIPDLKIEAFPGIREIQAPEETGATFEENAALKAVYYSRYASALVFADDSGLEADGLGGEPGIYSARYGGAGATDAANNALLLDRLANALNRHGRFVCVIALARAGELVTTVRGTVEGEILTAPQGNGGFGYDPLFYFPPWQCAFGELAPDKKFDVSHRGNAFRLLFEWLRDHQHSIPGSHASSSGSTAVR